MRPAPMLALFSILLILISYSISFGCDGVAHQAADTPEAVDAASDASSTTIEVEINCTATRDKVACGLLGETARNVTTLKNSVRAGVNLSRALLRATTNVAVAIARTALRTLVTLT